MELGHAEHRVPDRWGAQKVGGQHLHLLTWALTCRGRGGRVFYRSPGCVRQKSGQRCRREKQVCAERKRRRRQEGVKGWMKRGRTRRQRAHHGPQIAYWGESAWWAAGSHLLSLHWWWRWGPEEVDVCLPWAVIFIFCRVEGFPDMPPTSTKSTGASNIRSGIRLWS